MGIGQTFAARRSDYRYNTSYPLRPADWAAYRTATPLDFSTVSRLSLYVHIPFCRHLCSFCEYVRTHVPDEETQTRYVNALWHDVTTFVGRHPSATLLGFDIGGGTPTALADRPFARLMELHASVTASMARGEDFEPSVEATFQTLTRSKLRMIAGAGVGRVSLGIQSSVGSVQRRNGRVNPALDAMLAKVRALQEAGIKVNVDLMYGLDGQTLPHIQADLRTVATLRPQQVTLYELRRNMLPGVAAASAHPYDCYRALYEGLRAMGYDAPFGRNTFTTQAADCGLSSYLRHRMFHFAPYKGFGVAAQSLSPSGLSYNTGKDGMLDLAADTYGEQYTYQLPPAEMLAKYIAISAYGGRLSVSVANSIVGDFVAQHRPAIDFCLRNGYLTRHGDTLAITPQGFRHYGAVFSLFFPPHPS